MGKFQSWIESHSGSSNLQGPNVKSNLKSVRYVSTFHWSTYRIKFYEIQLCTPIIWQQFKNYRLRLVNKCSTAPHNDTTFTILQRRNYGRLGKSKFKYEIRLARTPILNQISKNSESNQCRIMLDLDRVTYCLKRIVDDIQLAIEPNRDLSLSITAKQYQPTTERHGHRSD